ncbi:MAG: WD40 repeat domain-containing protein, partial [Alphaproteobacteria bacterium]
VADHDAARGARSPRQKSPWPGRIVIVLLFLIAAASVSAALILADGGAHTASLALAHRAKAANDAGDHPKALLWALTGLPQPGELWPPDSDQARAQMVRAYANVERPRILEGKPGMVLAASFSPDGKTVVTASYDGTAKLWEAQTGKLRKTLSGHVLPVNNAVFDQAGRRVATTSGGITRIWDVRTGELSAVLEKHALAVFDVAFRSGGTQVMRVSYDGTAKLWDAQSGDLVRTLKLQAEPFEATDDPDEPFLRAMTEHHVSTASFSPDGTRLATGHSDGHVRIWQTGTGKLEHTLSGFEYKVVKAVFSPSGAHVAAAGWDPAMNRLGKAHLWDAGTGELVCELEGYGGPIVDVAFGGGRLVTTGANGQARIWDPESCKPFRTLAGPQPPGRPANYGLWGVQAQFSPDRTRLLTLSASRLARLWDVRSGMLLETYAGHRHLVLTANFSPEGGRLFTASVDGTARIWDTEPVNSLNVLKGHGAAEVDQLEFDPSGNHLLTAAKDGSVRLWDARTGALLHVLPGHDDSVRSAAFDGAGTRAVTASSDGAVHVWEVESGERLQTLKEEDRKPWRAVLDDTGNRALVTWSGPARYFASLWDVDEGRQLNSFTLPDGIGAPGKAVFSPQGPRVFTYQTVENVAALWDAETGEAVRRFKIPEISMESGIFSRTGTHLVTAGENNTAHIWDAGTGEPVMSLQLSGDFVEFRTLDWKRKRLIVERLGSEVAVWDLETGKLRSVVRDHILGSNFWHTAFAGSVAYLFSADSVARIWDVRTGTPLADFTVGPDRVRKAVIDDQGTRIAVVSRDNEIRLWEVPPIFRAGPESQVKIACALARQIGVTEFDNEDMREPILRGRSRNPCRRPGPLSRAWWVKQAEAVRDWVPAR